MNPIISTNIILYVFMWLECDSNNTDGYKTNISYVKIIAY